MMQEDSKEEEDARPPEAGAALPRQLDSDNEGGGEGEEPRAEESQAPEQQRKKRKREESREEEAGNEEEEGEEEDEEGEEQEEESSRTRSSSDVSSRGYDELMEVLIQMDPATRAEVDEQQERRENSIREDLPDVINRTVDLLRRLHNENERRKLIIRDLQRDTTVALPSSDNTARREEQQHQRGQDPDQMN